MMTAVFDTILGLPAHPLFVHAAVVLLPLMAIVTALVAWRPASWPRLALPVAVLDLLVVVATWVAKESGEKLEHRLPPSDLIEEHAELGDVLPLVAVVVFLCAVVPVVLTRLARRPTGAVARTSAGTGATAAGDGPATTATPAAPPSRVAALLTAVVATIVAAVALYLTFRVGHSGAAAVWQDTQFIR